MGFEEEDGRALAQVGDARVFTDLQSLELHSMSSRRLGFSPE